MDSQTIFRRRWVILSVLIVGLLAIVIDNTVLNVALKTIAEPHGGLGASQSQLEWAINSYTLVFAGLLFTFGVVGDKIGRKRMLMIGLVLFGIASLLSAYAQTPDQLIVARAAMGLGGAAVMPQTLSIISNVFEPAERPRAIGLWAMAVGIGVAIGPVLGGVLLTHFWWGSVFLINVPVTVIGAIAAAAPGARIPQPRGRRHRLRRRAAVHRRPDSAGVRHRPGRRHLLLAAPGRARPGRGRPGRPRAPSPGTRRASSTRPWTSGCSVTGALSASVGAIALMFFGMGGVYFFTSFYLQNVRGYSPLAAGLLTVPFAVGQLLACRAAPSWSAVRRQIPSAVGMFVMAAAIAGYASLGTASPIWLLGVMFAIQGAAIGLVMPAATAA